MDWPRGLGTQFDCYGQYPRCVIVIKITEVYSQCARALQRSNLWTAGDLSAGLPSVGQILQVRARLTAPHMTAEAGTFGDVVTARLRPFILVKIPWGADFSTKNLRGAKPPFAAQTQPQTVLGQFQRDDPRKDQQNSCNTRQGDGFAQ